MFKKVSHYEEGIFGAEVPVLTHWGKFCEQWDYRVEKARFMYKLFQHGIAEEDLYHDEYVCLMRPD